MNAIPNHNLFGTQSLRNPMPELVPGYADRTYMMTLEKLRSPYWIDSRGKHDVAVTAHGRVTLNVPLCSGCDEPFDGFFCAGCGE